MLRTGGLSLAGAGHRTPHSVNKGIQLCQAAAAAAASACCLMIDQKKKKKKATQNEASATSTLQHNESIPTFY